MKMFRKPYYTHINRHTIHEINLYLYIYICLYRYKIMRGDKQNKNTHTLKHLHTQLNTYTHT